MYRYRTWVLVVSAAFIACWYLMATEPVANAYLGVYHPVDPSIYSEVFPADPNPHIKETAALFTHLIQLFIDMRYLESDFVHFPPHENPRINLTHPARYGFTKDVVDLYQMIPYVTGYPNWNHGSDGGEFILWGEFLSDLRESEDGDDTDVWEHNIIDPTYALDYAINSLDGENKKAPDLSWDDKSGPYIKAEYAVLSNCGNHGSIMVFNTKNWHMWLIDQLGESNDPAFSGKRQIRQALNENDLLQYPSRPATAFLNDMINRFRGLEWIPGGLYGPDHREYDQMKQIYYSAGWPDSFNATKFDDLRAEAEKAEEDFQERINPLERLDSLLVGQQRLVEWRSQIPVVENEINELEIRLEQQLLLPQNDIDKLREKIEDRKRWLKKLHEFVNPMPPEQWKQQQHEMREELERAKSENQLLINRQGRFSEVTEDEYQNMIAEDYYGGQVRRLEAYLADVDEKARHSRIERETRRDAELVDEALRERWLAEQVRWWGKDDEWVKEWKTWFELKGDSN